MRSIHRLTRRGRRAVIVCLHDVLDRGWFEAFVDYLRHGAEMVGLEELVERRLRNELSGREICLTFDDGFRSMRDLVHPVLSERGVPYLLFVNSDPILGGPLPWFLRLDALVRSGAAEKLVRFWTTVPPGVTGREELTRCLLEMPLDAVLVGLEAAEQAQGSPPAAADQRLLRADEVAWLSRQPGVTIGSHTDRHPILSRLTAEEQRQEIEVGLERLSGILGHRPRLFAFPNGTPIDFDDRTLAILKDLDVSAAVTTVQRPIDPADELFRLPRIGVSDGHSFSRFAWKRALPWFGRRTWSRNRGRLALRRQSPRS